MSVTNQYEFQFRTPADALDFVRRVARIYQQNVGFFRTDRRVRVYDSSPTGVRDRVFAIADEFQCLSKMVLIHEV